MCLSDRDESFDTEDAIYLGFGRWMPRRSTEEVLRIAKEAMVRSERTTRTIREHNDARVSAGQSQRPATTITLSPPEATSQWVEQQAQSGGYASASDYVLSLIRREQARAEKDTAMQAAVTQGLESGHGDRCMDELRQAACEELQRPKPRRK